MYKFNLTTQLLDGELWWGGFVTDGNIMPFGKEPIKRSLCPVFTENQTMPLLISNKGRYIWSDEPFDYVLEDHSLNVSSNYGNILLEEGHINLKGAYLHANNQHFPSTGDLPEELFFTMPQYNTWIELMYDQTESNILNYAHNIVNEGYPTGVLMIDDNWQEDYGVLKFHEGRFNDPKGMVQQLHDMGFKVMLWISPFVSPDCSLFRELRGKDYLVKDCNNKVAIREWWNGHSAVLDLSNPAAADWFRGELNQLRDEYGIDGFKFDAGDPHYYYDDDNVFNPSHSQDQCIHFAKIGLDYKYNEYRASFKVAGLPLVQRLRDKTHTWDENGLASLIPHGLAQGLMGYSYNCPDMIGGGEYKNFLPENLNIDEELVVRYAECSALFPMMQFSVAPWRVLSPENAKICLDMANLHHQFGDYILATAKESSVSGEPIMRHMAYSYGSDYDMVKDQFLIGESLLVAPVITKDTYERKVLIPEGTWLGDDGASVHGPCTIKIEVPITRLPYYIKQ